MDESSIIVSEGGTTFDGPDAVRLYHAIMVRLTLRMLIKGIRPTRGATIGKCLKFTSKYTGTTYKRNQAELAIADLTIWIETMKSALPIIDKSE